MPAPDAKRRFFCLTSESQGKKLLTCNKAFDYAWLLHQKRGKHHWQWWILPEDDGGIKVLPMPDKYRKEMLADWRGAGKAQGTPDSYKWYMHNKEKMQLHPDTRKWVECELQYGGDIG